MQISDTQRKQLSAILNFVTRPDAPHWYKSILTAARVLAPEAAEDDLEFEQLPIVTWKDLVSTPLKERLYTTDPYFPKVVSRDGTSTIIAVSIPYAEREQYGDIGDRPFVAAQHITDAMELGLYCYGKNRLPLLAEKNVLLSVQLAKRYAIDSFLARTDSFLELFQPLLDTIDSSSLKHLSFIGTAFPPTLLASLASYQRKISLIVSPREAGSCAASCPNWTYGELPVFHPEQEVIAEATKTLIISKLRQLPTPLIRYDTSIPVKSVESRCRCGRTSFVILD